jgi:hypothetical protein
MAEQAETSTIGAGVTIVGDVDAAGSLRIDGSVRGRVFVHGTLDVGPAAAVEGFVQALEIDVRGRLAGVVRAATEVRLHPDAKILGDVEAPRVRFVKVEVPGAPAPAVRAPAPPPAAPMPPPAPPVPVPAVEEEEDDSPALPPAAAGQTPGVLPPWPPQGIPRTPPVWAPRSARPATTPPPAPPPPVDLEPVAVASADGEDGPAPPPPSITGGRRQIVVRRK